MNRLTQYYGAPDPADSRYLASEELKEESKNQCSGLGNRVGNSIEKVFNKLGMLEDIEEELGCSLDVLFKALNDGIWYQDRNKLLYEPLPAFRECCIYVSDFDTYVSPSDYKKTWWLKETKEE